MTESTSQHLITANNKQGKGVFYQMPKQPKTLSTPFGTITTIYTNPVMPFNLSIDATADLNSTAEHSQTGLKNGRICLDNGLSSAILVLKPGAVVPMHRTRTLDIGVVLEGEVEMHLDSGEKKLMRQGDTVVQRGAMHKWVNASGKDCKMCAFVVDALPIIDAQGAVMGEEFLFE